MVPFSCANFKNHGSYHRNNQTEQQNNKTREQLPGLENQDWQRLRVTNKWAGPKIKSQVHDNFHVDVY